MEDAKHHRMGTNANQMIRPPSAVLEMDILLCTIISHEIKKHVASPKRRFNRIRSRMPERTGYYAVFALEIHEGDETSVVQRRYADFKALHQMVRWVFVSSASDVRTDFHFPTAPAQISPFDHAVAFAFS